MKMRDKLVLIEGVASTVSSVAHIEMTLRILIAQEIMNIPMDFDDTDNLIDVYESLNLDNPKKIFRAIGKKEYFDILELTKERFRELSMSFSFDDIDKIKELSKNHGNKNDKK